MNQKLSPTMTSAIEIIRIHGGELECWRGGYWTYPGCPVKGTAPHWNDTVPVPDWYVGTGTMSALQRRGLIKFEDRGSRPVALRARLTEKA